MEENAERKSKSKLWIIIAIVAVVLIIILAAAMGTDDATSENGVTAGQTIDATGTTTEKTPEGVIGDYVCKVKSAEITKNWEGKDTVKVTYEFTNNNKDPQSFDGALEVNLYQDGVGLETTFLSGDDSSIYDVEIKNGVTKEVIKYYILRDKTTPIEVEISELFSFDDTKITNTINL